MSNTVIKALWRSLLILAFALCITCFFGVPSESHAAEGEGTAAPELLWSDLVPVSQSEREALWPSYYSVNAGTEADPYIISNGRQLALFAKIVSEGQYTGVKPALHTNSFYNKYIRLSADIDLAGYNWVPIGVHSSTTENQRPFLGSFDGGVYNSNGIIVNHYQIQNLTINTNISTYPGGNQGSGLFAYIGSTNTAANALVVGTVKNLSFTNVGIYSNQPFVGTVAGVTAGVIKNCFVLNGSVENYSITNSIGNTSAGGITGISRFADIDNSINYASVSCYFIAGGIGGNMQSSTMVNEAAGILRTALITNCINYGPVGGREAGGIAGRSDGSQSSVYGSQTYYRKIGNHGNIFGMQKGASAAVIYAGGLIGHGMSGAIWGGYNEGRIISQGTTVAAMTGGLLGDCGLAVSASYSTGDVMVTSVANSKQGALIGDKKITMDDNGMANYFVLSGNEGIVTIAHSGYSSAGSDKNMFKEMTAVDFNSGLVARFLWAGANDPEGKPYWYFIAGSKPHLTISTAFIDVSFGNGETAEYDGAAKEIKISFYSLSGSSVIDDGYNLKIYRGTSAVGLPIKEKNFTSAEINDGVSLLTDSNVTSADNYYVVITLQSVNNYAVGGYRITVDKRNVYVRPSSATAVYGSSVNTFDDSCFEVINSVERILAGDTVTGVLSRTPGNNVGTYSYIINRDNNPLMITTGGEENTNYNIILMDTSTYRIEKKEITPTLLTVALDYGQNINDIQSSFKNFIYIPSGQIVAGDTITVQDARLTSAKFAAGTVNAGNYASDISVVANSIYLDSVSSQNYRINYDGIAKGALEVRKVVLTVKATNQSDKKELNTTFDFSKLSFSLTGFKYNDTINTLALSNPLYTYFVSDGAVSSAAEGYYDIMLDASLPNVFTNYRFDLETVIGQIRVVSTIVVVSLNDITVNGKLYDGTTSATFDASSVVWYVDGVLNNAYFTGVNQKPSVTVIFADSRAGVRTAIITIQKPEAAEYVLEQWQITSGYSAEISKLNVKLTLGESTMPYGNMTPASGRFNMNYYYNQNDAGGKFSIGDRITDPLLTAALDARYYLTAASGIAFNSYNASEQAYSIYSNQFVLNTASGGGLGDNFIHGGLDGGASGQLYITKRLLTAPKLNIIDKYYDGTTAISYTVATELSGSFEPGTVSWQLVNAGFSQSNAGAVTCTITGSNFVLTGSAAANYQIAPTETQVYSANIMKRSLRLNFITSNFAKPYGYEVNVNDFTYIITDLTTTNQTFINTAAESAVIRNGITIYCSVSGTVPISTGNKILPIVGEYDNYRFLSSDLGVANLNITENIISYPRFIDLVKTYIYGDTVSIPEAYIDDGKLSINSGVIYHYEFLLDGNNIDRSEIRDVGIYIVKLVAIPKAGYGFPQGEPRKEITTEIRISKKTVYLRSPNFESSQGVKVDLTELYVRDLISDGLVGFDGNEVWKLSTGAKLRLSFPDSADGLMAGAFPITLSVTGGTITAKNYTAVFDNNTKGQLTVTATTPLSFSDSDRAAIVDNVFDSGVTVSITSPAVSGYSEIVNKINEKDSASRKAYAVYVISANKDGAAYTSPLAMTIRLKIPDSEYKDMFVYEVLEDGTYRLINAEKADGYFVFTGYTGGVFLIAGTEKGNAAIPREYIIYGGIAAIIFATLVAVILAKKTGGAADGNDKPKKSKKKGKEEPEKITSKNWTPSKAVANAGQQSAVAGAGVKVRQPSAAAQQASARLDAPAAADGIPMLDFNAPLQHTAKPTAVPELYVPILPVESDENGHIPFLTPEQIDLSEISAHNPVPTPELTVEQDGALEGFLEITTVNDLSAYNALDEGAQKAAESAPAALPVEEKAEPAPVALPVEEKAEPAPALPVEEKAGPEENKLLENSNFDESALDGFLKIEPVAPTPATAPKPPLAVPPPPIRTIEPTTAVAAPVKKPAPATVKPIEVKKPEIKKPEIKKPEVKKPAPEKGKKAEPEKPKKVKKVVVYEDDDD